MKSHLDNDLDFDYLINLFLANIDDFKNEHFRNSLCVRQLIRIIGIGSKAGTEDPAPEYLSDYLNAFIHLNEAGIEWYQYFQTKFNEVYNLFNKKYLPKKSKSYFKYLPEINCCELLLLLETDFYLNHRTKYSYIFEKYLFFFGNCIKRAEPHAVCFIDEALFLCLLFKKKYETFEGNILSLQWELWMMTLVNRRKYQLPKKPTINLRLDQANLMNVIHYINHIPSIESAILYYQEPQHPRVNIFMLLDDVVFILGFSSNKITINSCMGQILKSALLSREIKKIVHYNPCLGEETSFNMPSKKDEIINFIRKHNKLDPVYPENFLIKGLTKYFVNIPDIACQHHSD